MSGGLVAGYAVGWVVFAAAFIAVGVRRRSAGLRVVVSLAVIGGAAWPVLVVGAVQWAVGAAIVELARTRGRPALQDRPSVDTGPLRSLV